MLSRRRKLQAEKKAEKAQIEARLDQRVLETFGVPVSTTAGALKPGELWWCKHYQWFKDGGYLLRSRYAPDWVPSWKGTKKDWMDCEDCRGPVIQHILDATRITDGTFVTLKLIRKSRHPYEIEIGQLFSTEPLASDPANHCVPIYDVLHVPDDNDQVVIVMPLLRPFTDPCFDTCGEVVECFRQLFVGLQFIHKQHVAHRDCMDLNIMMDATRLFIHPFHPQDIDMRRDYKGVAKSLTRTQCPPKYFYIDFGISRRYDANNAAPLEEPIWGGDKTVPEFQNSDEPRNPFLTDIYYLGNMIRNEFLLTKYGLEFMAPLVGDMVQDDPTKRPTMGEVVTRFDEILKQLSSWKLRSRVIDKEDGNTIGLYRDVTHWTRRVGYIIRRVSALPTP